MIARIRGHWPPLRGDSHYCAPEVLRFCRANRVELVGGNAKRVLAFQVAGAAHLVDEEPPFVTNPIDPLPQLDYTIHNCMPGIETRRAWILEELVANRMVRRNVPCRHLRHGPV